MPGFILVVVAISVMYWLASAKRRIATQINSAALRADAAESIACAYLSMTVVLGLIVQAATGAWWVDSVTALAIVRFSSRKGLRLGGASSRTRPHGARLMFSAPTPATESDDAIRRPPSGASLRAYRAVSHRVVPLTTKSASRSPHS